MAYRKYCAYFNLGLDEKCAALRVEIAKKEEAWIVRHAELKKDLASAKSFNRRCKEKYDNLMKEKKKKEEMEKTKDKDEPNDKEGIFKRYM